MHKELFFTYSPAGNAALLHKRLGYLLMITFNFSRSKHLVPLMEYILFICGCDFCKYNDTEKFWIPCILLHVLSLFFLKFWSNVVHICPIPIFCLEFSCYFCSCYIVPLCSLSLVYRITYIYATLFGNS